MLVIITTLIGNMLQITGYLETLEGKTSYYFFKLTVAENLKGTE